MVKFTLPEELRGLFSSPAAKDAYQLFFAAASASLAETLASPRWLGAVDYVCRTAIGDSRIVSIGGDSVSFRWKDRAHGGITRIETIPGLEKHRRAGGVLDAAKRSPAGVRGRAEPPNQFVRRYLQHVLPRGLRAIRYYGYCHPAGKAKRERVALHTGAPLFIGPAPDPVTSAAACPCPCCGQPMIRLSKLLPPWQTRRPRPEPASQPRPPPGAKPDARSCA